MDYSICRSGLKLESYVILSDSIVSQYLDQDNFLQLSHYLKDKFKMALTEDGCAMTTFPFSKKTVGHLVKILALYLKTDEKYSSDGFKQLLIETAKALRTYAITEATRKYLNNEKFYEICKKIIEKFCSEQEPHLYHKFVFQLLLNILTLEEASPKMYNIIFDKVSRYFIIFTKSSFECFEATALIWNLTRFHTPVRDLEVIERIINLFMDVEEPNEYLIFLLTKFVTEECFWENYELFSQREKCIVLGVLKSLWYKKHIQFPSACMLRVMQNFENISNVIVTLAESRDPDAAFEVATSVELLSAVSSVETVLNLFDQTNKRKDLLISASALLITAHKAGKMPGFNKFTPIVKLGQFRDPNLDLKTNPAFGFKVDLVRLIGNLCYKNREVQDLARDADIIPVILDCCNMDAKNPFIIQWVTLAIRNLCEDNLENQKIIAGLQQQGAVRSELLEEMGLAVHAESDRILKVINKAK